MVADAVDGERRIAMAVPLPGRSTEERPPVHPVCGLGRIVHHEPLEDGRSHVVLHGETRIRIHEELESDRPYRLVRAEVTADVLPPGTDLRPRARTLIRRLGDLSDGDRRRLEELPPGRLVDAILGPLAAPIQDKQRIHANPDVAWRLAELEALLDLLGGSRYRTELRPDDPRMN
jgi:Lon protease-like protein